MTPLVLLRRAKDSLDLMLEPLGLESHLFQTEWYNSLVSSHFNLSQDGHHDKNPAFVIISKPEFFEKCVLPHIKSVLKENPDGRLSDPMDGAVISLFQDIKEALSSMNIKAEFYHDFDMHPGSRKAKILVQTAAHVAGAVQYFHKKDLEISIQEQVFSKASDLAGVALHPIYGGWFAIRGVIIITNMEVELSRPPPLNLIEDRESITKLLQEFAYNWEENKWRNVYGGSAKLEYSKDFKDFLNTKPGNRWEFIVEKYLSS